MVLRLNQAHMKVMDYYGIVEEDGIHHLILTREFIEVFIEASSKYAEAYRQIKQLHRPAQSDKFGRD